MSRTQWFTRRLWLALLMVFIALFAVACDLPPVSTTTGSRTVTPTVGRHRIAVRSVGSQAEFYDVSTGRKYIPRGVNLINLVTAEDGQLQDRSFAVGVYHHDDIAAIFDRL